MKCDVFEGSVVNGLRQPVLYIFISDKPPGYKFFCEPGRIPYTKNKSVLNSITFYLEGDDHKEVDFNGKTLNFILQLVKV